MVQALAAYIFAASLTFLQQNLQFIDEYYKDKQNWIVILFSLPIAYGYFTHGLILLIILTVQFGLQGSCFLACPILSIQF